MQAHLVSTKQAEQETPEQLFEEVVSSAQGLSSEDARRRLEQYGPNALEEEKINPLLKFLTYFWGPIPWMIETAAVLSLVVRHWADLAIILTLLLFNAGVGFWEEFQAGNAIEALKRKLALNSRVLRDRKWQVIAAHELVPGDVIRVRLGDIIPADAKLIEGDYLSVDQSALTGESLPVDKKTGDVVYSGSVAKQGEMVALVTGTGSNTYFGQTAKLVGKAKSSSHFQKAVLQIGRYLIYLSLGLVAILIAVQIMRGTPILTLAEFALILVVASIPVAMPAVLSVTMAAGALLLSKMKAIVARLESIEEMAGMDILCSDKTGTLTQNRLTLSEPATFGDVDAQQVVLMGALASKEEDQDSIDLAVIQGLKDPKILKGYQQEKFVPFDPVAKRTEANVKGPDGRAFRVSKGAPQVIKELCRCDSALQSKIEVEVDRFAEKGNRTLGVARSDDGEHWIFLGLLPLYDPPREDARDTIARAEAHGIHVKMITGDNDAIACEIARQLGMDSNIQVAGDFLKSAGEDETPGKEVIDHVEQAAGFAQVFPEHKYAIVKALQAGGHIVGMTGDGVNDAPALKQAEVGTAVSGATDAARAAADLVLTAPGLSVIVGAVEEARKIFERMNSYAIYRIVETLRIMFFVTLAMTVYNLFPITAVMIILLALLNDLPIMSIAYDNTWLDPLPVRWNMRRVLTVATVLGTIGVVETFLLLVIAKTWFGLEGAQLQSIIFLKLAVAGHLTLFVARTHRPFYAKPHPAPILLVAILSTQTVAAMIVGFGWLVASIPWYYVGLIWLYCLVWIFIEDLAKLRVYKYFGLETDT